MFTKFNDTSITTKFIKNLISTSYLPNIPIWVPGKPILKNYVYITNGYIVKAINSSGDKDTSGIKNTDTNYFKIISEYIPDKFYPGINQQYNSNSLSYDSDLHYYLGSYLRMYRDLYNINLMPYYNCVKGSYTDTIRIRNNKIEQVVPSIDGYKVVEVNINFNEKYTIYIDCSTPFNIGISYNYNNILNNLINEVINIPSCSFRQPFVFNGVKRTTYNQNLEDKYLTMYIQLPNNISSNVVVLEGDYSNTYFLNYIKDGKSYYGVNRTYYGVTADKLTKEEINDYCRVLPNLITKFSNKLNAFDNKLIEYLTLNIIDDQDKISNNVERVQNYISSFISENENGLKYKKHYIKGVWDDDLRMFLYDLALVNSKTPLTTNVDGYVDKDLETIITRGQDV